MRRILAVAAAFLLCGCAYVRAVSFEKDPLSAVEQKQKTSIYLIERLDATPGGSPPPQLRGMPAELLGPIKECLPQPKTPLAFAPAIIGFLVDQGISMLVDELAARVEALAAKGQKSYAALTIASADDFSKAQCLVIVRESVPMKPDDKPTLGLALILKKEVRPGGESMVLTPTYLQLANAVAITAKGKAVDLAIALSAKAAYTKGQARTVEVFASTTFAVPGVELGAGRHAGLPQSSGLMPLPPANASQLEIAVGITESGSGVPDAKKARAALEALQKAIGPVIVDRAKQLAD